MFILGDSIIKHVKRLVLAHININAIRNKFDTLVQQITNNIHILMISETKLDNSLSKSLDDCKVYVKDFSGARVRCMQDYLSPTIRENHDHIILHVVTNDLTTKIPPEKVAESIIDLTPSLKSNSCSVAISNITVRNDRYWKKEVQVNGHLKTLFIERNFELITHDNIITGKHLDRSKLHLNKRGRVILSNTFI